jgi:ParB-like chromosome segregation protein Spo0J
MKVKICDIKPNPFKRFINEGELDSERIDKLMESIEHGTLPAQFVARKNEAGKWEQTSGHHRLAAFKKKYGKEFEVDITPVKFSDELMLVDMVRENITQRNSDFQDTEASIVLARNWLQSKANGVNQFHNIMKGKKGFQEIKQEDSVRSVADFLSKSGKTISYRTVANYLNIHDKLDPTLHKKVGNFESKPTEQEEGIGVSVAAALAKLPKEQQREAYEHIKEQGMNSKKADVFVTQLKGLTAEVVDSSKVNIPDEVDESITFEDDFKQTASEYQNTLFLLQKIKAKHFSKVEFETFIEQIEEIMKEESRAIKKLKELKA